LAYVPDTPAECIAALICGQQGDGQIEPGQRRLGPRACLQQLPGHLARSRRRRRKLFQGVEVRQRVLVASQFEEALGQRHPSELAVLTADGHDLLEEVDRSGVVTSPQP
jgi:hypothetical protein